MGAYHEHPKTTGQRSDDWREGEAPRCSWGRERGKYGVVRGIKGTERVYIATGKRAEKLLHQDGKPRRLLKGQDVCGMQLRYKQSRERNGRHPLSPSSVNTN